MNSTKALILAAGLVGVVAVAAGAGKRGFEPSQKSVAEREVRGVLAVRGTEVLAEEGAARLYTPASVLKLVVAAAALHHLGPKHRLVTTAEGTGAVVKGVLQGDLVLRGAGDPSWGKRFHPDDPRAPLAEMARQLHRAGVRRIAGDLMVDTSRFPGPAYPDGRSFAERSTWYGAPATAVAVDESVIPMRMAPGPRPGAQGQIPEKLGPFGVVNRVVTVGPERAGRGSVEIAADPEGLRVFATGEYPISEQAYALDVVAPAPELYAGLELAAALKRGGIALGGKVRVSQTAVSGTGKTLARIESPPLSELLVPILEKSHNWYAEMLLRALALEVKGAGRIDLGLEVERDFLVREVGVSPHAFWLEDASGLAPGNLIAPEAVVALLLYAGRQSWRDSFVNALARPSEGTLRGYGEMPPVRAKTGTIQNTQALAGYLRPEKAEPVAFAIFLNHRPGNRRAGQAAMVRWLRQWDKQ